MSKTVLYKDYTIRSTPIQHPATGLWSIETWIASERAGVKAEWPFALETAYQTEQEADIHGITFRERVIDGKVPGLSVD